MTPKELFDTSMKMAEFSGLRLEADRSYEWKLSLSLWALLAGAIHTFRVKHIGWWIPTTGLLLYAFWVYNFWWAHRIDNIRMHSYLTYCSTIITNEVNQTAQQEWVAGKIGDYTKLNVFQRSIAFLFDWSSFFQLAVTTVLVALAYHFCQTVR